MAFDEQDIRWLQAGEQLFRKRRWSGAIDMTPLGEKAGQPMPQP
ncbi:MAG: hypothetical protein ACR2KT_13140 [Methylocella sp.]